MHDLAGVLQGLLPLVDALAQQIVELLVLLVDIADEGVENLGHVGHVLALFIVLVEEQALHLFLSGSNDLPQAVYLLLEVLHRSGFEILCIIIEILSSSSDFLSFAWVRVHQAQLGFLLLSWVPQIILWLGWNMQYIWPALALEGDFYILCDRGGWVGCIVDTGFFFLVLLRAP